MGSRVQGLGYRVQGSGLRAYVDDVVEGGQDAPVGEGEGERVAP